MHHRLQLLLLAVALLATTTHAQVLPTATPESVGMSSDRLAKIGTALQAEVDAGKIPGAVVMIARHGKLVYNQSFGYREKAANAPMTPDTIFRIYSMTKPLVSVAAMMLVEDGKLQLTDPVSKYLPAFKSMQVSVAATDTEFARITYGTASAVREMTVQDLLRHTAGLAYGEISQNAPVKKALQDAGIFKTTIEYDARDLSAAEQVERLAKVPLAHQPGAVWEYSLASDVLGRVVEAAAGQRLSEFLDKRLFKQLGMADAAFWLPSDKIPRLAQPLATDPATGNPIKLIDVSAPPASDSGGAGAVATASDYLRFATMLSNGGRVGDKRVLSRTTVALMTSDSLGTRILVPVTPGELLLGTPGYTFGLGFAVRQGPGVAGVHGSQGEFMWGGYAGTYFWVDPKEEIVAVYMSQATGPTRPWYRRLVKNLTYQAIVD
ncbi:MAG: beta-lactamase family protein [Burkholderiales bacterium]|nr:beta-lactamase family protein [Burkholderiales bacterium]